MKLPWYRKGERPLRGLVRDLRAEYLSNHFGEVILYEGFPPFFNERGKICVPPGSRVKIP